MSGAGSKAWMVATAVGAVEGMKDQGFCNWNHAIRSVHQHAKKNPLGSLSQLDKFPSSSSSSSSRRVREDHEINQSEESMRTVMYLSCWGPNT